MHTPDSRAKRRATSSRSRSRSLAQNHAAAAACSSDDDVSENQTITDSETPSLLPGLPNHLAQQCLSALPPGILHGVCRSWRSLIYSPSFPPFFSLFALVSPKSSPTIAAAAAAAAAASASASGLSAIITTGPPQVEFVSLDLFSWKWKPLPMPPPTSTHLLHHHPSFISRNFPIQSLSVSGRLVLIAATNQDLLPALVSPLAFDPLTSQWFSGPPLSTPRRWCVSGSVRGVVYVGSGMGSSYQSNVARSLEKWDMKGDEREWRWEKMAAYKDGRFSREAMEAVGLRGKLHMVNTMSKGMKEGAVYDTEANRWEEMPTGMLAGWRGPVAVDEDRDAMYVVHESRGVLRRYNLEDDRWEDLMVCPEYLRGAEQLAAGRGRVCAVAAGGEGVVVVDVAASPSRIWVVEPPEERKVVAVHILPRMCQFAEDS